MQSDKLQPSDEQRDAQNAQRWFFWGTGQWGIRYIQAFKVPAAEPQPAAPQISKC
jgi:hypothetical protein